MIFSTLLSAIASILHTVIEIYTWVIIIAAIISWVRPDPSSPLVQLLYRVTEPAYAFIRRFIPTVFGGIDLAPIIILLVLKFIDLFFVRLLVNVAATM